MLELHLACNFFKLPGLDWLDWGANPGSFDLVYFLITDYFTAVDNRD
jgi:hypothetical protein